MSSTYRAQRYDQFVDLDDPQYKKIQVRRFYRHHPRDGELMEVDARAIGSNFNISDSQLDFTTME